MPEAADFRMSNALPYADLATITGDQNVLVLASAPLDASLACGGLIAMSCCRGRPPYVMVLGDGTAAAPGSPATATDAMARRHDRETRLAMARLGLGNERLLMAGLYGGQIPADGPVFEAVIRAVTLVMWSRDCNIVCAPAPGGSSDEMATYRVAEAVSARSGVGLLTWASAGEPEDGFRLDIGPVHSAKRAAIAAHAAMAGAADDLPGNEVFVRHAAASAHVTG